MQSAPNGMPPTTTSTAPQSQPQMAYEPQYYYSNQIPAGSQPMPTYIQGAANGQTYQPQAYYQDANGQYLAVAPNNGAPQQQMMMSQPYIYMQPQGNPTQNGPQSQQMMQSSAQPQIIYYSSSMGHIPSQGGPMYYQPMPAGPSQMMTADQMGMMQTPMAVMTNNTTVSMSQQPQQALGPGEMNEQSGQRGPLTSSTPLPTSLEYESQQRENGRQKNIQFRYHRIMEHDDDYKNMIPLDELSKITPDQANDDTISAEKENHLEVRSEKSSRRGNFIAEQQALAGFSSAQQQQLSSNYKTRLCMMHASGTKPCELGHRCKFAHGLKELRSTDIPVRFPNNKYKTKLCKNFARGGTGFCPYGLRCEFVHPTDKEFQSIPVYQRMQLDEKGCFDPDMTPEDDYMMAKQHRYAQIHVARGSARSSQPTKVLLKHRNVAGSMTCLTQTGRDNLAGGDFNKSNNSHENLPPHMRRSGRVTGSVGAAKLSRRMSLSQLKTKWTSEENLRY